MAATGRILELSPAAFDEIQQKLLDAGFYLVMPNELYLSDFVLVRAESSTAAQEAAIREEERKLALGRR